MQDFDLVSPTGQSRTEEGSSEYEVLRYRGYHLAPDRCQLPLRLSPDTDRVHLHRAGTGMLSMHPLLVVGDCDDEDCEDEHLFSLVGAKAAGKSGRWTAKFVAPTGETPSDRKAGAWLQNLLAGKRRLQRIAGGAQRSHEATDPNRLSDKRVLDRRWRIDGFLGCGGMGYVYETRHVLRQEQVGALKTLPRLRRADEGLRLRFEREVLHLDSCRHPGVVRVLDRGHDRGQPFFVMELATGWPADGEVHRTVAELPRPLSRPLFLDVAKQVVDALAEVHRRGLVHRDVKPSNLLLFDGGLVKLGDFGAIRDEHATGYSVSGVVVGTPLYASPEQIDRQPDQPLGPRSDVFSLGVALYQLLTDRLPFPALGLVEQITQKLRCKPPVLEASDEWESIVFPAVMRCLAREPDDRFE